MRFAARVVASGSGSRGEDEATFQAFFDSTPEIPNIMSEAGVTTVPEITMWRKLELGDDLG